MKQTSYRRLITSGRPDVSRTSGSDCNQTSCCQLPSCPAAPKFICYLTNVAHPHPPNPHFKSDIISERLFLGNKLTRRLQPDLKCRGMLGVAALCPQEWRVKGHPESHNKWFIGNQYVGTCTFLDRQSLPERILVFFHAQYKALQNNVISIEEYKMVRKDVR